ncbi:DegT/DnrJ/EryC1/StrS aminotransferase family protein [Noviherbaspirillum sp.]|uniref:DegT/DnrJ/EryC1/StrS family aminotransferase n=1 Tax=Noviherbaspirillum sp. TaxID=1926288 RepID=UPI002B48228F|nr:DegT/DnrJ/EryC1/StrS aminotransferase family protein [Noviherbaspirillum sp.]HJV81830.1 DegT/DnrJ/EryC1/StrS aminotransferase family protein [Noviherbaspirillum sp.]
MLNTPFPPWPSYTSEEANSARNILLSNKVNYWTGVECCEFEREFAAWAGTQHAVALANGTAALEVALHALCIGPGDEVVVTPRTFMASASCIVGRGARPVFADVDRNSQNISADTIRAVLTPRTRAVICVHLAGMPCDMDPIMALAGEHGLHVVEDCAQAHGARYKGRSVGSLGHIAAWSFCQDKIMTTGGEGGMATTSNREWWASMWSFKDHGKSWEAMHEHAAAPGFRWVHESFGTNMRMLEMQAAIGRIQLRRMPEWGERRRMHAERIATVCRQFPAVRVPDVPGHVRHAYYKFYAFVEPERLADGWSRDRILAEIVARGVPCYHGTCPEVYLEKAFDGSGYRPAERLPVARELGETSLMFLVHPTLSEADIEKTCSVLEEVLTQASGGTSGT